MRFNFRFFHKGRRRSRSSRANQFRTASIESLENRILPSGTVTLTLDDGNLTIEGDGDPNNITVTQTGADEFTVIGNDGEMIVGGPAVSGVTGDVIVDLKEGADIVVVEASMGGVPDDLIIDGGAGNDNITVEDDATVNDDLNIDGGLDDDTILVKDATVEDDVYIIGGVNSGTNSDVDEITLSGTTVEDSVRIEGGRGIDTITLNDEFSVADDVRLIGQIGADVFTVDNGMIGDDLRIFGGAGDDTTNLGESDVLVVEDDVRIDAGANTAGNMTTVFGGRMVGDRLVVKGGDGADYVTISGTVEGRTTIKTHGGEDTVTFDGATLEGGTRVLTGSDGDIISTQNTSTFKVRFVVNCGAGIDQFSDDESNTYDFPAAAPDLRRCEPPEIPEIL